MLRISRTEEGNRYDILLTGSLTNLLIVGIVVYLKENKILRNIASIAGSLSLFAGGLLFILPNMFLYRYSAPFLLGGFGLTICAILAGNRFNLFIGDAPEVQERKQAELTIKDSKDPYASLELDSKRLSEYYAINQSQARGSFRWAVFAMFCGLSTIVAGIWIFYLRQDTPDTFLTSLTTAAGVVINAISSLYLYLHNKSQRRSLYYYGQLVRTQQLGLAIRLAESHEDATERTKSKNRVIDDILAIVRRTAEVDSTDSGKESA